MTFRLTKVVARDYACFKRLELELEHDLTILFAENGGGKTSILRALATGLGVVQSEIPDCAKLIAKRDVRTETPPDSRVRSSVESCEIEWFGQVGEQKDVHWSISVVSASNRRIESIGAFQLAVEKMLVPDARWPIMAFYGVDRLRRGDATVAETGVGTNRMDAYDNALDPENSDEELLTWLLKKFLGDAARAESERYLGDAVLDTLAKAAPGVKEAWYDFDEPVPLLRFESGLVASWRQISDGFHAYLALVADIARRAMILNGHLDGPEAGSLLEGIVLIDEIDLHLHPGWQRIVLKVLRATFPNVQFVITTNSPQVLSSAKNRQVRFLRDYVVSPKPAFVEGRDSNAILTTHCGTDERDEWGDKHLQVLDRLIAKGEKDAARKKFAELRDSWGPRDPELVERESLFEGS